MVTKTIISFFCWINKAYQNHSMKSPRPFIYLLVAMYTAGLIGLNIPQTAPLFRFLTPFNLIASLCILLYFHPNWNQSFKIFALITFLIGYFIEVLGVKTGLIFGKYQYDSTLGFEILEVPPVIGVNWLMLIYCVGVVVNKFKINSVLSIFLGAITLTALDYIVEPVAINQKMWSWYGQMPPLQNYIGWFVISTFLLFLFNLLVLNPKEKSINNPIAQSLLVLNILFFLIQRWMIL